LADRSDLGGGCSAERQGGKPDERDLTKVQRDLFCDEWDTDLCS
jgi:hypothetical protein